MPSARKREPIVPTKVKEAFEYILATPGATLQSAALHVGIEVRQLRHKMQRPESLRWMLHEKQARLEVASAGNINSLLAVRDHGDNAMAKVHAAKTLETMLDAVSERTGIGRQVQQQRQPGLQIVVIQPSGKQDLVPMSPGAPLIEGTSIPDVEPVPADTEDRGARFGPAAREPSRRD
jgi:hypothetical protein